MGQHHAGNPLWIHIMSTLDDDGARFPRVLTKCDRVVKFTMTTKGRQTHDDDATCPDCAPFRDEELA